MRIKFGEPVPEGSKFIGLDKYAFTHTKVGESIFPDWEQVAIYEIPVTPEEHLNAEKARQGLSPYHETIMDFYKKTGEIDDKTQK